MPIAKERGLDLLCPVLDLTPQGRSDWYADLSYGTRVRFAQSPDRPGR